MGLGKIFAAVAAGAVAVVAAPVVLPAAAAVGAAGADQALDKVHLCFGRLEKLFVIHCAFSLKFQNKFIVHHFFIKFFTAMELHIHPHFIQFCINFIQFLIALCKQRANCI